MEESASQAPQVVVRVHVLVSVPVAFHWLSAGTVLEATHGSLPSCLRVAADFMEPARRVSRVYKQGGIIG